MEKLDKEETKTIDVLVVGAGPSGLTFAIECMRYGLNVRIIEKAEEPTKYSKAIAIQARTLETFQRMGIHREFLEEGLKLKASNIYCGQKKLAEIHLNQIPSSFPFVLSVPQSRTEAILIGHLNKLGCKIERSTALESFEEKDGIIFANTGNEVIQTKYLIGCDGPHSTIRKDLGYAFKGKLFPDIFSLADVEITWDLSPKELHVFLENDGIMAALPLPDENRYRLIFQLKRLRNFAPQNFSVEEGVIDSEDEMLPNIAEIEEILSSYVGKPITVSNPRWIANFHINSRLSSRYRRNNIFLVGDAAHIHSPVGGQGMNTGIQDAFNLAWKIAYSHKGLSNNSNLLDSYEKERHTLGKKLLKSTEEASRLATIHAPFFLFIRKYLISFFLSFRWLQKIIVGALSEVNIRCGNKRMDNILLNHDNKDTSFYYVTEKSTNFHLILFNVENSPLDHPNVDVFHAKNAETPKAILVRPDGYIALEDTPPFRKLSDYKI